MLQGLDAAIKSGFGNISGIVVIHHGAVIFEKDYHGYSPNDARHVASVSKSILSALIGIAVEQGYLKGTDQKAADFFPDARQDLTLRHLLTMTAPFSYADWQEPLEGLCTSPDWVRFALDLMDRDVSLGGFKYSSAGAHLLSAILSQATGKNAREFANEHLFGPIGMRIIPPYDMEAFGYDDLFGRKVRGWVTDPAGHSAGGWGLTLTPRDMARFGLLYLNRGVWEGKRIVPEWWIEESTAANANHYGYLWWLLEGNGVSAFAAMGDGGNTICCIPGKGIVVAVVSEMMAGAADRWALIQEHIIPALA